MYRKRGQISVEYMAIIGVLIVIAIPLFYYTTVKTNQEIKISQADTAVNALANTADSVYALSPGSKKYVWITIPKGVESSSVTNREALLQLSIFGSTSEIYASTKAELVGGIPTAPGLYKINVEMLEDGRVSFYIGETTTCSLCKTRPCNTYTDCSVGTNHCVSGYCCEGDCSNPICSGFCMSNSCDNYADCADETGQCESGYCCTGTCGISTCSGYCMPLECSNYDDCSSISGENCASGSCCTGTCTGSGGCCCEEWGAGICGGNGCDGGQLYQTRDCIPDGCNSEERCIEAQSHDYLACYDNDVYWYNECNSREDKYAECGTTSCGDWEPTTECCDQGGWWYRGKRERRLCTYRGCSVDSCFENSDYEYRCVDCPGWGGYCSVGVCY